MVSTSWFIQLEQEKINALGYHVGKWSIVATVQSMKVKQPNSGPAQDVPNQRWSASGQGFSKLCLKESLDGFVQTPSSRGYILAS